jgi:hypothetical protein
MQDLFDDIVGTPPPSTLDTHALVARDRRVRAAKWSLGGVGAMAVAGVAVVAIAVSGGSVTPVGPPAPPQEPVDTFVLSSETKQKAEDSAAKLKAALTDGVTKADPEAKLVDGFVVTVIDYTGAHGWQADGTLRLGDKTSRIGATAHELDLKDGTLSCASFPAGAKAKSERMKAPVAKCTDLKAPSGKPVTYRVWDSDPSLGYSVEIQLPAGRVMSISLDGPSPVMSKDQAIALADNVAARIR